MEWFLRVMWLRVTRKRSRTEDTAEDSSPNVPHISMAGTFGALARFMRRPASGLAFLSVILTVAGCNDYGNTFQNPTGASISFLAPADASAGGTDFTLSVTSPTGGFVLKTVVQWNGKTIPTNYVSATTVTATVAAALIAKPGTASVNTLNPFSGTGNNGLSNVLTFIIDPPGNPVPAITSISPNTAAAGSASFA